ncbi:MULTISPECIES: IspD/TarI family cytidylyltransferase [Clostridia]|uniref:Ribitol-5-phosphate cytidylyltransferase n=1 Tax=Terrisporobacter glycolicus ATCC 14880 = DSM 1288 TaxID=1121315 RepID=A0ABZ2F0W9_9FIRM|nr:MULTISPECIES: IspD/TarI family cytidylyltransferase [Clostridia]MDB2050396.1 IspD/TarI family cytidylyltransferase [Clostridium perfringens]
MISAVIFAGGVGSRMKYSDIPKQFIEVEGKPIIIHTLEKFDNHPQIDKIVVSCLENWIQILEWEIQKYNLEKVVSIVKGGSNGHESIHNGLVELEKNSSEDDIVLICDGVRPMITEQLITNCIEETKKYGTAVPVTPSIDSVLESNDGVFCNKNYERSTMYITQAPQGYYMEKIMWAHDEAKRRNIDAPTSSSELLIELGEKVHLFIGERQNIKVTTPEDLYTLRSSYYYDHYKSFAKEELKFGL